MELPLLSEAGAQFARVSLDLLYQLSEVRELRQRVEDIAVRCHDRLLMQAALRRDEMDWLRHRVIRATRRSRAADEGWAECGADDLRAVVESLDRTHGLMDAGETASAIEELNQLRRHGVPEVLLFSDDQRSAALGGRIVDALLRAIGWPPNEVLALEVLRWLTALPLVSLSGAGFARRTYSCLYYLHMEGGLSPSALEFVLNLPEAPLVLCALDSQERTVMQESLLRIVRAGSGG
ncbi:MAG: hypothetical protein AB1725_03095 [Armatimonadota bacterium]